MRTPRELYKQFRIMPNLQLHQLRVAAVGKLICEHFTEPINTNDVVLACLFHDMGNILKFDLKQFPQFTEPEGIAYWEGVKADFAKRYGTEHHHASATIAREAGLPENIVAMIGGSGYTHIPEIAAGHSWETKVLKYADLRVAPFGVVSLNERFADFARRYGTKREPPIAQGAATELERKIFAHTAIGPQDITDEAVAPIIGELWEYPVP